MADEITDAAETKQKGRPGFVPTDEQRAIVRDLVAKRVLRKDICRAIGVSAPTLREAFAADLTPPTEPDLFAGQPLPDPASLATRPPASNRRRPSRVPKARGGRPRHQRTEATARRVLTMAAAGSPPRAIAIVLKISEPTLTKYYADELDLAAEVKFAEMAETLEKTAANGNVTAQRAYLDFCKQTQLARISDRLTDAAAPSPPTTRAARLGKKEQAVIDAEETALTSSWADVLPPAAATRMQ